MRDRITRRILCLTAPAAVLARQALAAQATPAAPVTGAKPEPAPTLVPLRLDEPLRVDVVSQGVAWKGHTYHLVRLHQARFRLDEASRLTAIVSGGLTTFDKVDYDLHAAVFDAAGRLLGTARAVVPVERVWLGKVLSSRIELPLDFGISDAYRDAKSFTLTLSRRKVLTPDDWQK